MSCKKRKSSIDLSLFQQETGRPIDNRPQYDRPQTIYNTKIRQKYRKVFSTIRTLNVSFKIQFMDTTAFKS